MSRTLRSATRGNLRLNQLLAGMALSLLYAASSAPAGTTSDAPPEPEPATTERELCAAWRTAMDESLPEGDGLRIIAGLWNTGGSEARPEISDPVFLLSPMALRMLEGQQLSGAALNTWFDAANDLYDACLAYGYLD